MSTIFLGKLHKKFTKKFVTVDSTDLLKNLQNLDNFRNFKPNLCEKKQLSELFVALGV